MTLLRSLFGSSKNEIWGQIAKDIGGHYDADELFKHGVLRYQSGSWEISLDTYTVSTGKTSTTYTRMRAPFINKDGLRFTIYPERLFSFVGKFFGMQDIEIGDSYFDNAYIIKGNNEEKIRWFLEDPQLKALIQAQPDIYFEIRDDEGWFRKSFPQGVNELYFMRHGLIKDERLLKGLFDLFSFTLERLVKIDSAYQDDPQVRL